MTIFFTSDTHFNHANIIGYCNRPWLNVDEMNRGLIERWNATVGPEDTVWHLGDFAMGQYDLAAPIFEQLNGTKRLIVGNHDSTKVKKLAWASVDPFQYFDIDGNPLGNLMIHDPGKVVHKGGRGVCLHGHLHGMSDLHPFEKIPHLHYIDVGVDCWDYRPIRLEQALSTPA